MDAQNAILSTWEWTPGDANFYHEILDIEWLPLPPSTVVQGRHAPWHQSLDEGIVLNLKGWLLQEVEEEASHI